MSRQFGRFVKTVLILIVCLGGLSEAGAQSAPEFNRIASVVADASGKFVLVTTHLSRPLPAPNIQYLPGGDGETVLVADFPGIVLKGPPRVFAPAVDGLQQVHIGQFQDNPPILRMAFTATRPAVLRKLSFNAAPGTLVINLPEKDSAEKPASRQSQVAIYPAPQLRYQQPSPPAPVSPRTYQQPTPPAPAPQLTNAKPARQKPSSAHRALEPAESSPRKEPHARGAITPYPSVSLPARAPAPARSSPADIEAPEPQTPPARRTTRGVLARMFTPKPSSNGFGSTETARLDDASRTAAEPASAPPSSSSGSAPILPAPARLAAQTFTIKRPAAAPSRDASRATDRQAGPGSGVPSPAAVDPLAGRVAIRPLPLGTPSPGRPDSGRSRLPPQLPPLRPPVELIEAPEAPLPPPPLPPISPNATPETRLEDPPGTGITVRGAGPVRIDVAGAAPFTYRSFRLHEPERHVIDIQGLPELAGVSPPEPEPNPYVTSVRVGNPDGDPSTVRVVLDLKSAEVDVKETSVQARKLLAILIEKGGWPIEDVRVPPGMSVVIDAGHGGSDPGAQRGDIKEKELTLAITDKLRKALEANHVKVTMTRIDDTFVSLADRVTLTNGINPHAFVSVHINSLETNSTINGIETYYQTEHSRELARSIHDCLVTNLAAPDRAVRRARFYVINHTPVPAVLAEVGFISNRDERDKLISSDYQQEVANAVARGVILYLSKRPDLAQTGPGQERGAGRGSESLPPKAPDVKPQSLAEARPTAPRQSKP